MLSATQPSFQELIKKDSLTEKAAFLQEPFFILEKNMINERTENQPEYQGWLSTSGFGPTVAGRVYSGAMTCKELALSFFYDYPAYNPSEDPAIHKMQKRVLGRGVQLGSNDVYEFINEISRNNPVYHINEFYFQAGIAVNYLTFDQIKETIDQEAKDFHLDIPICIPVNFGSQGLLERNHIAIILIKDGVVDYYDSKGIISSKRSLQSNHTLEDVLEYCLTKFTREGKIVENPYMHQYDSHSCAVFICNYLFLKIVSNQTMGELYLETLKPGEIQDFRNSINQIAYEKNRFQSKFI